MLTDLRPALAVTAAAPFVGRTGAPALRFVHSYGHSHAAAAGVRWLAHLLVRIAAWRIFWALPLWLVVIIGAAALVVVLRGFRARRHPAPVVPARRWQK